MGFEHIPVLLEETIEGLKINPKGTYVDCTVGGAGHSLEIVKRIPEGRLIAIDQDERALAEAKDVLSTFPQVQFVHRNFSELSDILADLDIEEVDGILMDIGVSSHQFDEIGRGFSYREDAPLDMRMDQNARIPTAMDIVNEYSEDELTRIFYDYGEERWSRRIAQFIVDRRKTQKLETTLQLVDLIKRAIPKKVRMRDKHPARRVFQALRIEVNHELDYFEKAIESGLGLLAPGGRMCVITFHSLEDRIAKEIFRREASACLCPPELPVCVCGHKQIIRLVNRKPIVAGKEERERNRRSRSAKLRVIEKLGVHYG